MLRDETIVGHIPRKIPQHAPCFCFKWARCCARPPRLSASQWMYHKVAWEFCALWSSLEVLKTLLRLKKLVTGASVLLKLANSCYVAMQRCMLHHLSLLLSCTLDVRSPGRCQGCDYLMHHLVRIPNSIRAWCSKVPLVVATHQQA